MDKTKMMHDLKWMVGVGVALVVFLAILTSAHAAQPCQEAVTEGCAPTGPRICCANATLGASNCPTLAANGLLKSCNFYPNGTLNLRTTYGGSCGLTTLVGNCIVQYQSNKSAGNWQFISDWYTNYPYYNATCYDQYDGCGFGVLINDRYPDATIRALSYAGASTMQARGNATRQIGNFITINNLTIQFPADANPPQTNISIFPLGVGEGSQVEVHINASDNWTPILYPVYNVTVRTNRTGTMTDEVTVSEFYEPDYGAASHYSVYYSDTITLDPFGAGNWNVSVNTCDSNNNCQETAGQTVSLTANLLANASIKALPVTPETNPACFVNWTNSSQIKNYTIWWWAQAFGESTWALNTTRTNNESFVLHFDGNNRTADEESPMEELGNGGNFRPSTSGYGQEINFTHDASTTDSTILVYNSVGNVNFIRGTISLIINATGGRNGGLAIPMPYLKTGDVYLAAFISIYDDNSIKISLLSFTGTTAHNVQTTKIQSGINTRLDFTWEQSDDFSVGQAEIFVNGILNATGSYNVPAFSPDNITLGRYPGTYEGFELWVADMQIVPYVKSAEQIRWEYDTSHVPRAIDLDANVTGWQAGSKLKCEACAYNNNSMESVCINSSEVTVLSKTTVFERYLMKILPVQTFQQVKPAITTAFLSTTRSLIALAVGG